MPALCFMPVLKREELIAALKNRIPQIKGQLEHVDFAIAQLPNPGTPEHVKELYRLSASRVAAEVPWAEALIQRLEQGEYEIPHPAEVAREKEIRATAARGEGRRAGGARRTTTKANGARKG
jgi:hypothetical protein